MRLVLDLQAAQANNRTRGIGRYSLALAQAMARQCGDRELYIALNARFAESVASLRADFDGLVPRERIRVWHGTRNVGGAGAYADWSRRVDERTREAFLAELRPDIVHVGSIFEGFDDDAVTSVGVLGPGPKTAATLYDLIPLVHRDIYLRHREVESWYRAKLQHLQRAGLWLAISEHSRGEAIAQLDLPADRVVNISAAADAQFRPLLLSQQQTAEVLVRYGVNGRFVMYTGGIDHRKNIDGLLKAYALLPHEVRNAHQLMIVCHASEAAREALQKQIDRLQLPAGAVVLTGFVPDGDLVALYNLCTAFVFPSWHEGFGLPALEAMACGAAVIAANCTSLPEVIGRADALFDPRDATAIAAKLTQVLQETDFREALRQHGLQQAVKFSWQESARRALAAFDHWHEIRQPAVVPRRQRPKLAMVSPLPPLRTGIAAYSAELVPALAEHYDVDVIIDQPEVSDAAVMASCQIRSIDWFEAHADSYDRIVYQFGNSHFHKHMFAMLERHPGVVTLHDFYLSNALFHMETHGHAPACWSHALYASHGFAALSERFEAGDAARVIEAFPVNHHVLQGALGVVVHSRHALEMAQQWYAPEVSEAWTIVPQVYAGKEGFGRATARKELGVAETDLVVCSFGIVAKTKLNHRLLEAWLASSLRNNANAQLVFVGDHYGSEYGDDLVKTMRNSGASSRMKITGFCSERDYALWLSAADVAVQLRTASRGETSRAVLDCMNAGLPTIVNAHGSMRDFAVNMLLQDDVSVGELAAALEHLAADAEGRRCIGERARHYLRLHHEPRRVAEQVANAVENFYGNAAHGRQQLLSALAGLGADQAPPGGWSTVAKAVAQTLRPTAPQRQLLIDVSALTEYPASEAMRDAVSKLVAKLVRAPGPMRVEPVLPQGPSTLAYARTLTCRVLGIPPGLLIDEPVEYWQGDTYLQPFGASTRGSPGFLEHFRLCGGTALQLVEDAAIPRAGGRGRYDWAPNLVHFDGAICRTREAAMALFDHLEVSQPPCRHPYSIGFIGDDPPSARLRGRAAAVELRPTWAGMLNDGAHPNWLPPWRPRAGASADQRIAAA